MSCSELAPQTGGDLTDTEKFVPAYNNKRREKLQSETIHAAGRNVFVI
jgi:hypothetical protein